MFNEQMKENMMVRRQEDDMIDDHLMKKIRALISSEKYVLAEKEIEAAMRDYPDDPDPHNLMGILMEHENKHLLAMKHFRASLALDPAFLPSRFNMEKYGGCFGRDRLVNDVYDNTDRLEKNDQPYKKKKI